MKQHHLFVNFSSSPVARKLVTSVLHGNSGKAQINDVRAFCHVLH